MNRKSPNLNLITRHFFRDVLYAPKAVLCVVALLLGTPLIQAADELPVFRPSPPADDSREVETVEVVGDVVGGGDAQGSIRAVVRTIDGLPLEVEILELFSERIKVRILVSNRVIFVPREGQNPELLKQLQDRAAEIQKIIKRMKFQITIVENSSRDKQATLSQGVHVISSKETPSASRSGNQASTARGNPKNPQQVPTRILYPGARCLRLHTQANFGIPVPVTAHIYWYARVSGKEATKMVFKEVAEIEYEPNVAREYFSQSPPFPRTAYQGYAVLLINPKNNTLLFREATLPSFLEDAEIRQGLRQAPPPPPPPTTGKKSR